MKGDGENQHQITLDDGSYVQWRKDGIKVLGCALGLDKFCQNTIKNTANKIERDLECLDVFPFVHQRFELATHCSNTRITYFLRAMKLRVSGPITAQNAWTCSRSSISGLIWLRTVPIRASHIFNWL